MSAPYEPLRVAQVGLGRWGQRLLPRLLAHCEVPVVCNRSGGEGRDHALRTNPAAQYCSSITSVLGRVDIDAVAIATPIDTHGELVRTVLEHGKHVYVTKPLCTSAVEAGSLVELAERNGLTLFVGHTHVYHPAISQLIKITAQRPVRAASSTWQKWGTFDSDIWYNLGSHEVAVALALLRESPKRVELLHRQAVVTRDSDILSTRLTFSDERVWLLQLNRASRLRNKALWLELSDGGALIWEGQEIVETTVKGETLTHPVCSEEALDLEIRAFIAECRDGGPVDRNAIDVVSVLQQL